MQPPQFSGSLPAVLMQAVDEHCVNAHVAPHTPDPQKGAVAGQIMPHAPQFMGSDCVLTQAAPHVVNGAAHAHCEA
ncbi:MAG: hypothetical protein ABI548_19065 [Polyangiaceae bacterium]